MQNINSKILWLADFDLSQSFGGAQRSDEIILDFGKRLGLNIFRVNHQTFGKHIDIHNFDIVVSSNLAYLTQKNDWLIDEIAKHKYHVRLEHDSNTYLTQKNRVKLFGSCKKTFFLTNYHHKFFINDFGDIFKNVEIISDPIDISTFCDHQNEREDKILYVGYMHPLKGSYNFFDFAISNPDNQFVVSSWTQSPSLDFLCRNVPNVKYLGTTEFEKMPDLYNKYKALYYNPDLREPFCRSVAEAVLCGMTILTSRQKQIGCLEEIKEAGIEKFKNNCKNASVDFWSKI